MKQIVQSYRTGELRLSDVPLPALGPGQVLIQTAYSAVSLGTEGKKVSTARQSLVGKARSRPDMVRQVIHTAQREGVLSTYRKVSNRLDEPMSLGYSAAGTVIAVGPGVLAFAVGDRVACGGEHAAHAEVLTVPVNLCAKVPESVSLEQASFATIGAIALQGIRQAEVTLGECVTVIGLGLLGQLAVQLLKANGCRVLGIDLDPAKVALAVKMGIDKAVERRDPNLMPFVSAFSRGHGMDAVLITAGGASADPMRLAVELSRDRGRVVVVGAVRMEVSRDACYQKELEVKLSRSYGPGRYDPSYEEKGVDYPIGYVRWTEQRNMQAFLDLLGEEKLRFGDLITHRFSFDQAEQAYSMIASPQPNESAPLGIVFEYDTAKEHLSHRSRRIVPLTSIQPHKASPRRQVGVGFIGAGSFARKYLIPPMAHQRGVRLVGVSTATGISGQNAVEKFGFAYGAGDHMRLLNDPEIHAVFIATRHNLHAQLAVDALEAGKAVFVEKPLALTGEQLDQVIAAYQQAALDPLQSPILMVGFNRRFAPLVAELGDFMSGRAEPCMIHYRINAGYVDAKHWTQDVDLGGGRILGEVCHFVDLLSFLVGAPVTHVHATGMSNTGRYHGDNVSITLAYADGSVGHILYAANGDTSLPKERLEVFAQGSTAVLDDFARLDLYRQGRQRTVKQAQDKGHTAEVAAFLEALREGDEPPISFADCVASTRTTLWVKESLQRGMPIFEEVPVGSN